MAIVVLEGMCSRRHSGSVINLNRGGSRRRILLAMGGSVGECPGLKDTISHLERTVGQRRSCASRSETNTYRHQSSTSAEVVRLHTRLLSRAPPSKTRPRSLPQVKPHRWPMPQGGIHKKPRRLSQLDKCPLVTFAMCLPDLNGSVCVFSKRWTTRAGHIGSGRGRTHQRPTDLTLTTLSSESCSMLSVHGGFRIVIQSGVIRSSGSLVWIRGRGPWLIGSLL